jgi:phosphinothricin acetyltransferase
MIRSATPADADAICVIYNHYIRNTAVTFEEVPVEAAEMRQRIAEVQALFPWLVAEDGGQLVGYAYAARWRVRSAYRYSVESTVYLSPDRVGRGWGSQLYLELFRRLEAAGIHAVMGGITLPNPASVGLHEKLGFRKVAHFEAVGWKGDQWLDVGYWQRILDSASPPRSTKVPVKGK